MMLRRLALLFGLITATLVSAGPLDASAGTLGIYEGSVSPGSFMVLPGPANSVVLDIDYDALSAEGGGVYGLSELTFFATGGVTFDAAGFTCELSNCFFAPEFFIGGKGFRVTGGDNLNGVFSIGSNLVTVQISGNTGYVGVASGEYLDATSAGSSLGNIQTVDLQIFARVPEPSLGLGLLTGCVAGSLVARRRAKHARHVEGCSLRLR